jgi:hypothetical protein
VTHRSSRRSADSSVCVTNRGSSHRLHTSRKAKLRLSLERDTRMCARGESGRWQCTQAARGQRGHSTPWQAARGSGTNEGVTERTPHRPTIHNIPSRQVESGPWILWRKGRDAAVSAPWGVGGRAKGGPARGRRTNCKLQKMWRGEIDSSRHVGSYNAPREISHPAPSGFVSWQRLQTVRNLKLWLLHDGHRQSPSIRDGGGGGGGGARG